MNENSKMNEYYIRRLVREELNKIYSEAKSEHKLSFIQLQVQY